MANSFSRFESYESSRPATSKMDSSTLFSSQLLSDGHKHGLSNKPGKSYCTPLVFGRSRNGDSFGSGDGESAASR